MAIHYPLPSRTADHERLQRLPTGVDYQRLFAEPPPPVDTSPDALDGMRQQDPDAYRMVIYSWA